MNERLKIYTSPSAFPNPQRLRLLVHEKGVAEHFDEVIYDNVTRSASSGSGSTSR